MKTGWKTTEFWATLLVVLSVGVGWLAGKLDGNAAVVVAAVASGLYAVSRGLAKGKTTDEQLRNAVYSALMHAGDEGPGGNGRK